MKKTITLIGLFFLLFLSHPSNPLCVTSKVTIQDIKKAHQRLAGTARHTPLVPSDKLSTHSKGQVYLKLENFQHTGSFKIRGAFNKIASIPPEMRAKGVIAASAGNHAQGVALAAKYFNIPALIVMPENAPKTKLDATRAYGAKVVLNGTCFDHALAKALELEKENGMSFVHAFDDACTIAGQGTIGLEILQDIPDVDIVLIPVGGGGLASGIATAIKSTAPQVQIIGVEPQNVPSLTQALKHGGPLEVKAAHTIAEGTAILKSGNMTYSILKDLMDKTVLVSETQIKQAIKWLLLNEKTLAEGAGALGVAALLSGQLDVEGKKVVIVISGGNIDTNEIIQILQNQTA